MCIYSTVLPFYEHPTIIVIILLLLCQFVCGLAVQHVCYHTSLSAAVNGTQSLDLTTQRILAWNPNLYVTYSVQ